ncbi:Cytosolic seryl-tRNA synthetase, partial [Coemansia nantahalensis]
MLDINLFQAGKGGNPEAIRKSQRARGANPETVDEIIQKYQEWTGVKYELDEANRAVNAVQKEIAIKAKAKEDASGLLAQKKDLDTKKKELSETEKAKDKELRAMVSTVGNIVHESVPVSTTEDDNEVIRTHFVGGTEPVQDAGLRPHHEVLYLLGGFDSKRGAN